MRLECNLGGRISLIIIPASRVVIHRTCRVPALTTATVATQAGCRRFAPREDCHFSSAPSATAQTHATLDAAAAWLPRGMARGWPAQLGGVVSGSRAAALTRESPTVYAAAASSWKAPCRARMSPPLPAETTATLYSSRRSLSCVSTLCESVVLACSAACREPIVYW